MSLALPRADDLRVVCLICRFLEARPDKRATLSALSAWLADNGFDWKRSRIYHYTSACRDLGLAWKPSRSVIALTEVGSELAEEGGDDWRELTARQKRLVQEALPHCETVARYLALFMPDGQPPSSLALFRTEGQPISIVGRHDGSFILTDASGTGTQLDRNTKRSYAWTLYGWLRTLDLADSVYHEDVAGFFRLSRFEKRVFYPLKRECLSIRELREVLVDEARHQASPVDSTSFFIPDLLAGLCARAGMPKEKFLSLLVELVEDYPSRFHLEMMSSLRMDERCAEHYRYENFPRVDGVYRSHLWVNASLDWE